MKISLDHILIKDFLKVLETDNFHYFSKSKRKAIQPIWGDLLEEYEKLLGTRRQTKEITTRGRIEGLLCKYKAINNYCESLSYTYTEEALDRLKSHYYFIDKNNYQKELVRIKRESESIFIQIEKLKNQLPKEENKTTSNKHIDEIILGYCSFVGTQIKPNKCTVTEFAGLKNLFESKLKQLEKPTIKNGR